MYWADAIGVTEVYRQIAAWHRFAAGAGSPRR